MLKLHDSYTTEGNVGNKMSFEHAAEAAVMCRFAVSAGVEVQLEDCL